MSEQRPMQETTAAECWRHDRRAVLQQLGSASVIATLGAMMPAPVMAQQFATRIDARLQRLAAGVYAYLQSSPPGESDFAVANTGIIDMGDELLAIDATAAPLHATAFMRAARKATGKSIGSVVLTHFHGDHVHGLAMMGSVQVIAHEQCRQLMAMQNPSVRPDGWKARANWASGKEVFRLVLPSVTYSDRMALYSSSGRQIELIWLGRAHTAGDTCVHLPEEQIAFIGDIGFFGVTPLMGNGYASDWINACEQLLRMKVQTFVPGHGPVGGAAELADIRDYLIMLQRHARRAFDAGMSPARAAVTADLGKYASWKDADRVLDNVVRMYAEFNGTATPVLDREAAEVARREYLLLKQTG